MPKNQLLLIDCDILRYSHGAIEAKHPFLEGVFVPAPASQITRLVDDIIRNTCKACGTNDYVCILSGKGNFRNEIAKQVEYKGNRDPSKSRPYHFDTVGEHIINNHPHVIVDGHEADDYMGYTQYQDWLRGFKEFGFNGDKESLETIIASRDKDLRTVQGWHYSWSCGPKQPEKPLYYISPSQGMYQFFYQMLIGDNTDNIMGCGIKKVVPWGTTTNDEGEEIPRLMLRRKGVGEKTAKKILNSCKTISEMKEAVFAEYLVLFEEEAEDVLLENARLLFIGQTPDNLFEWSWLDKYMEIKNEDYVDPTTIPKKTRNRKKKQPIEVGTEIPVFKEIEQHERTNSTNDAPSSSTTN